MMRLPLTVLAFVFVWLLAPMAWAKYVPPPIAGHVTDVAGKLTAAESADLERSLEAYRARTSNEIAVFVPASLEGYTIEDVAFETFNTWKLGVAGKDNGVLVVVAPLEREVRIEVGKGLEGTLTDLRAKEIIDADLAPSLKASQYEKALDDGTRAIERALDGGAPPPPPPRLGIGAFLVLLVIGVLALVVLHALVWAFARALGLTRKSYREWSRGRRGAGGSYVPGYYGGASGGGGGGGFSGGGGSSGGGGASGSF